PVNGPQGWKKSDVPTTIIPPKPHPQIGRPSKKRKKSAAELADEMMKSKKLTKTGKSVTCKSCKQVGHNSRGCNSKKREWFTTSFWVAGSSSLVVMTSSSSSSSVLSSCTYGRLLKLSAILGVTSGLGLSGDPNGGTKDLEDPTLQHILSMINSED
ncbi:mutator type transposase, partial [Tanacetum coccineum]